MARARVAVFDSASAMVRALAHSLQGRDFARLGLVPPGAELLAPLVGVLSRGRQSGAYEWAASRGALAPDQLGGVRADELAEEMTSPYPSRRYPAALLGSANGAAVHLGATLGVPWLPQTVLLAVRFGRWLLPLDAMRAGYRAAQPLLDANPDLALHHMYDPNHDVLMLRRIQYFRVKHLRLPPAYRRFLEQRLEPGASVVLVECESPWPVHEVGHRHVFQVGGLGGPPVEEYVDPSPRVRLLLERERTWDETWRLPTLAAQRPEAEWSFEPALVGDVKRFCRERGLRLRRLRFQDPTGLSPLVADLHRRWYERSGGAAGRLLVETFFLMDPLLSLATRSIPFWLPFNDTSSAGCVERYLREWPFEEILLTLFSHGVDSLDLAPIERWRELFGLAERGGAMLGVDERAYPRDFATYLRFDRELSQLRVPCGPPPPPPLSELSSFLHESGEPYGVEWLEE
jgi:hypothetical protein